MILFYLNLKSFLLYTCYINIIHLLVDQNVVQKYDLLHLIFVTNNFFDIVRQFKDLVENIFWWALVRDFVVHTRIDFLTISFIFLRHYSLCSYNSFNSNFRSIFFNIDYRLLCFDFNINIVVPVECLLNYKDHFYLNDYLHKV